MRKCSNCGRINNNDATVCGYCQCEIPETNARLQDESSQEEKSKYLRKIMAISMPFIMVFLFVFMVTRPSDSNTPVARYTQSPAITTIPTQTSTSSTPSATYDTENTLEMIEVSIDIQDVFDGKQKIVVNYKNTAKKMFSGYLYVFAESSTGKNLGSDTVIVNKLAPGQSSYAIIWVKPSDIIKTTHSWSDTQFESPSSEETKVLDAELSQKFKSSYILNWEGTSWFDKNLIIEVYKVNDGYLAEIKTSKEDVGSQLSLANAVVQLKVDAKTRLNKVIVYDLNGNYLTEKENLVR